MKRFDTKEYFRKLKLEFLSSIVPQDLSRAQNSPCSVRLFDVLIFEGKMIGCTLFIDDLKEVGGLSVGRFGHPPPLSDLTPYKFIVLLESLRQGNNTPQISLNIVENITM